MDEQRAPGDRGSDDALHSPQVAHAGAGEQAATGAHSDAPRARKWDEPTVLTLQDLLDLPRQILPEETYFHLKNAGREATLALFSLIKSVENARRKAAGQKVRKRIDVE